MQRQKLLNVNFRRSVANEKENVTENVRSAVGNVVKVADNFAKNCALSKAAIESLQKCAAEEKELRAEVQSLEL